jgi:DNA gyrase/topoisomerase IV subunit A
MANCRLLSVTRSVKDSLRGAANEVHLAKLTASATPCLQVVESLPTQPFERNWIATIECRVEQIHMKGLMSLLDACDKDSGMSIGLSCVLVSNSPYSYDP